MPLQITEPLIHNGREACGSTFYSGVNSELAICNAKAMSFYVKDFAIIPEFHGKGVGTLLMNAVETYINGMMETANVNPPPLAPL